MQVYINILFRFERADCFCSKLIIVQRWIQESHNISDGTLCNNCKLLKAVKCYPEVLINLSLTTNVYTNTKIRIYSVCPQLLKVNNENYRTMCVMCSKFKRRYQNDLIDLKTLTKIDVALVCVSIVNSEKIPHLFLVFILEFQELLLAEFTR